MVVYYHICFFNYSDSGDSIADSYCQLDSIDLRECECMQILSCVYPQLVRHWRAAGSVRQTVHFLMEASAAAIAVQDNMQVALFANSRHLLQMAFSN